ncbi:fibrillin-1 [Biomphalaria glabrata]|nr:fibrillin-1 [Biomphalaria glabrata]
MKLASNKTERNKRKRFDLDKLHNTQIKKEFQLSLQNRFAVLQLDEAKQSVDKSWQNFKEIITETSNEVLSLNPKKKKQWISDETWKLIEERKCAKQALKIVVVCRLIIFLFLYLGRPAIITAVLLLSTAFNCCC